MTLISKQFRICFVLGISLLLITGCGGGGPTAAKVLPDPGKDAAASTTSMPTANADGTMNDNKK